jgi:CPA1 family monovalent cation:H+ antiporter
VDGTHFPERNRILFITFGVIIITLVGQGLMLPSVIRWLGLAHEGKAERRREREAEFAARAEALHAARRHLETIAAKRKLSDDVVSLLNGRHEQRLRQLPKDMEDGLALTRLSADLRMELIAAEREFLYQMLRDGKLTDEARRRIEHELDLEEQSILCKKEDEAGGAG